VRQQILGDFIARLHKLLRARKMVFSCIVPGDLASNHAVTAS
jgi:hypothetical protein